MPGIFLISSSELKEIGLVAAGAASANITIEADDDIDNDTILNEVDNCPNTANTDQADLDNDNLA